jgi:hypothetical protein
MIELPKKRGFSQRHSALQGPSRYLSWLKPPTSLHRSIVTLNRIRNDVKAFYNPIRVVPDYYMKIAINRARHAFQLPVKVNMLHLNDVFKQDLPIWNRSAGLPWKEIGFRTKAMIRDCPEAVNSVRWFWHRIKQGETMYAPDCCAFIRAHLAEPGVNKVRAVWGYPATMTFGEAAFAVPLIRGFQKYGSPMAYGYETAVGGTLKIVDEISQSKFKTAVDFKSFDKTVPKYLIEVAFHILAQNINFGDYEGYGVADARRNYKAYQFITNYFINTPIRICNGERYRKSAGVASGSYFTQLIDSVVNYIVVLWLSLHQHGECPEYIKVLGDDSVFGSGRQFNLRDADKLLQILGMKINISKSICSESYGDLTFLGYKLNWGMPTKPNAAWMAALMFPEVPDKCWDMVASRALGLLYACAGTDDEFDLLCRALVCLKPFRLKLTAGMEKMLKMIGIEALDPDPPPKFVLWKRLRIV